MRVLEITDGHGAFLPNWIIRTVAVMLYPCSQQQEQRTRFVARCSLRTSMLSGVVIDRGIVAMAMEAEHHPLAPLGNRSVWRSGELAGEQLAWMYSMAAQGIKTPSRRLAQTIIDRLTKDVNLPGSPALLSEARRTHGSAAHLWAAYCLRGQCFSRFECLGEGIPRYTAADDFRLFLLQCERIRIFATNYSANGTAKLVDEFWELPNDLPPLSWHIGWGAGPPNPIYRITPEIRSIINSRHEATPRKQGRPRKGVV